MNRVTTDNGVEVLYKNWDPRSGHPIAFHHGRPLSAFEWDAQMLYFVDKGYPHEPGLQTSARGGPEAEHYAADVVALVVHLKRRVDVHASCSAGDIEPKSCVARYAQGGQRVAKLVLIGAVPPLVMQTAANPGGEPIEVSNGLREDLSLFNHVVRAWLFAAQIGQIRSFEHDPEVTALGTLLHDITLHEGCAGGRTSGADVTDHARFADVDGRRAQLICNSIVLNSTASITLYKAAAMATCISGVVLDVIGWEYDLIPFDEIRQSAGELAHLVSRKRMTDCFCHIDRPEARYDNFILAFGERLPAEPKVNSAEDPAQWRS